jgi:hypothetical protein
MKKCNCCRKLYNVFRGKLGFCKRCLDELNLINPD